MITVIVRVIAHAGVIIAHAGVIAPLCVNFSCLESFHSFSAQGSESSHSGVMTLILVPPLSVRLHAVACGLRIAIVPRVISRLSGDFLVTTSNSPLLPFSSAFLSGGFLVFLCCVCSGCGTDEPQEVRHTGSSAYQFPP